MLGSFPPPRASSSSAPASTSRASASGPDPISSTAPSAATTRWPKGSSSNLSGGASAKSKRGGGLRALFGGGSLASQDTRRSSDTAGPPRSSIATSIRTDTTSASTKHQRQISDVLKRSLGRAGIWLGLTISGGNNTVGLGGATREAAVSLDRGSSTRFDGRRRTDRPRASSTLSPIISPPSRLRPSPNSPSRNQDGRKPRPSHLSTSSAPLSEAIPTTTTTKKPTGPNLRRPALSNVFPLPIYERRTAVVPQPEMSAAGGPEMVRNQGPDTTVVRRRTDVVAFPSAKRGDGRRRGEELNVAESLEAAEQWYDDHHPLASRSLIKHANRSLKNLVDRLDVSYSSQTTAIHSSSPTIKSPPPIMTRYHITTDTLKPSTAHPPGPFPLYPSTLHVPFQTRPTSSVLSSSSNADTATCRTEVDRYSSAFRDSWEFDFAAEIGRLTSGGGIRASFVEQQQRLGALEDQQRRSPVSNSSPSTPGVLNQNFQFGSPSPWSRTAPINAVNGGPPQSAVVFRAPTPGALSLTSFPEATHVHRQSSLLDADEDDNKGCTSVFEARRISTVSVDSIKQWERQQRSSAIATRRRRSTPPLPVIGQHYRSGSDLSSIATQSSLGFPITSTSRGLSVDDPFDLGALHTSASASVGSSFSSSSAIVRHHRHHRAGDTSVDSSSNRSAISLHSIRKSHQHHRRTSSIQSVASISLPPSHGPPNSLFNKPRRMSGAGIGRPDWASHRRQQSSVDSNTSSLGGGRVAGLARPGLGDRIFAPDQAVHLFSIQASPTGPASQPHDENSSFQSDSLLGPTRARRRVGFNKDAFDSLLDESPVYLRNSSGDPFVSSRRGPTASTTTPSDLFLGLSSRRGGAGDLSFASSSFSIKPLRPISGILGSSDSEEDGDGGSGGVEKEDTFALKRADVDGGRCRPAVPGRKIAMSSSQRPLSTSSSISSAGEDPDDTFDFKLVHSAGLPFERFTLPALKPRHLPRRLAPSTEAPPPSPLDSKTKRKVLLDGLDPIICKARLVASSSLTPSSPLPNRSLLSSGSRPRRTSRPRPASLVSSSATTLPSAIADDVFSSSSGGEASSSSARQHPMPERPGPSLGDRHRRTSTASSSVHVQPTIPEEFGLPSTMAVKAGDGPSVSAFTSSSWRRRSSSQLQSPTSNSGDFSASSSSIGLSSPFDFLTRARHEPIIATDSSFEGLQAIRSWEEWEVTARAELRHSRANYDGWNQMSGHEAFQPPKSSKQVAAFVELSQRTHFPLPPPPSTSSSSALKIRRSSSLTGSRVFASPYHAPAPAVVAKPRPTTALQSKFARAASPVEPSATTTTSSRFALFMPPPPPSTRRMETSPPVLEPIGPISPFQPPVSLLLLEEQEQNVVKISGKRAKRVSSSVRRSSLGWARRKMSDQPTDNSDSTTDAGNQPTLRAFSERGSSGSSQSRAGNKAIDQNGAAASRPARGPSRNQQAARPSIRA